jgi:hypothetical protein
VGGVFPPRLESGGMGIFLDLVFLQAQPPMPRLLHVHELRKHQRVFVTWHQVVFE